MITHQYYAAIQTAVAIAERNTTPEIMDAIRYDMVEIMEAYRTMSGEKNVNAGTFRLKLIANSCNFEPSDKIEFAKALDRAAYFAGADPKSKKEI